jgi:hypothetical protein
MIVFVHHVTPTLFCLISVGHTNSQLPRLFCYYILKRPTIISNVKYQWIFLLVYLDENSRQVKYFKISVDHTRFQPT